MGFKTDKRLEIKMTNLERLTKTMDGTSVDRVMTGVYNPLNHWMGGKIDNWIHFLGVDPADWIVTQGDGTACISTRNPLHLVPIWNLTSRQKQYNNQRRFL